MDDDSLRVGMIGYRFMGKAHSQALREVDKFFPVPRRPELQVLVGRSEEPLMEAQTRLGWNEYSTDWRSAVDRDDVDLIIIATPNDVHRDIAVEAARRGKHILCEKPLARNVPEAREMVEAAQQNEITHMTGFNYRRVPAIRLAKSILEDGRLGPIHHVRCQYLQDWCVDPTVPRTWRLHKERAGSGVLGDLASHLIDLARYLVGDIESVCGHLHTYVDRRPLPDDPGEMAAVEVDDMTSFQAQFENGAQGLFEATRFAPGRKNAQVIEINGRDGSLRFELEEMNYLDLYLRTDPEDLQGFRRIMVTEPEHPYIESWWPPGHIIGYQHTFVHQAADLLDALGNDRPIEPDFEEGLACQKVMRAVEQSNEARQWVNV